MINKRFKITNKIINSLNDTTDIVNEHLHDLRIQTKLYPGVLSQTNRYVKQTTFGNGLSTNTLTLPAVGFTRYQNITNNLVPPYAIVFTMTSTGTGGAFGAYIGDWTSGNYLNDIVSSIIPISANASYNFAGWSDYETSISRNGQFATELLSPKMGTGTNAWTGFPGSVTARTITFGFRELVYGQVEFWDARSQEWYSVNCSFFNKTNRQIIVAAHRYETGNTFILNMLTNYN
jgi:hypothetical protein